MKAVGDHAESDLFKPVVDTMAAGVVICGSAGQIQYVNDSFARLLETTQTELYGMELRELLTDLAEGPFNEYKHSFEEGEPQSVETTYSFDGTQVSVTEVTTRRTVDGEEYLFKTVSDLTERHKRERMLKRQNDKLQAQCEQLETQKQQFESFAQVASHDLRNPLGIAQGYLANARAESSDESLKKVSNALSRMEVLIDDLLALAEEGESVGEVEAVPLSRIADLAWENTETFDAELAVDEYRIYADPIRTQQLFENLFRNAIEHAGPDIEVYVGGMSGIGTSTRVSAETELAVGFYVSDNGPGVPKADREAVFSESFSTNENGTGLGLNTVKEIATAHGWQVRCDESRDGGARFEFRGTAQQPDA